MTLSAGLVVLVPVQQLAPPSLLHHLPLLKYTCVSYFVNNSQSQNKGEEEQNFIRILARIKLSERTVLFHVFLV